ncbi:hypothetical protein R1flu_001036 [Riccia fluitans]|uniref:F-box family protein n=1 Tax=Riccia fluitans TaxID=41844 RepID=A0ABD1Y247_9MARC
MESLPEEIWSQILCLSTSKEGGLGARDLCAFAVVNRCARRISSECKIWWPLVKRDFSSEYKPSEESQVHPKALYRIKHEKKKLKREAERRRQIMGLQSSIHTSIIRMMKFEKKLENERKAAAEVRRRLTALHSSSRASLALQRWQPQAVTIHHQRIVHQVHVDAIAEENSLKLELQERYHFIVTCEKALRGLERSIKCLQDKLEEINYNPIKPSEGTSSLGVKNLRKAGIDWSSLRYSKKSKKTLDTPLSYPSISGGMDFLGDNSSKLDVLDGVEEDPPLRSGVSRSF